MVLVILDVLYYYMYLGSSDCTVSLMDCTSGSMTHSTHTLSFTAPGTYTHHHSTETTPERSVTDPSKEAVRRNLGSMFRYAIKLLLFHSLMICTLWGIICTKTIGTKTIGNSFDFQSVFFVSVKCFCSAWLYCRCFIFGQVTSE